MARRFPRRRQAQFSTAGAGKLSAGVAGFPNQSSDVNGKQGLISADFSLYRDFPEEILISNCRANRLVDYALQQAGIPMIPTAGFAGESSWEWCFDGLPKNSTVAVTTNTVNDREARRLFVGGINAMVEKTQPTAIVVCGKCPDWLEKRFPEIQIVQIPNYSQMWHERTVKLHGRIRRSQR